MSNQGSRECIATMEHQQNLAELSQGEGGHQFIDPHIRSLVFESSQTDEGTAL